MRWFGLLISNGFMRASVVLLCLLLISTMVYADEAARRARTVADEWHDAVVTLKIVLEMNEYENKVEVMGTIIEETGLCVVSLSSFDPSSTQYGYDTEVKVKDIKIIHSDGREVPAAIVLRDKDLDLAFVRPLEKPTGTVVAVNLEEDASVEAMEQVLLLSRLGSMSGYAPYLSLCRVQSVVKKPRTFYVPDFIGILSGLGTPAFTLDGKVVGVLLLRVTQAQTSGMGDIFGGIRDMGVLPIILPAAEILNVAKHIPVNE